MDCLDFSRSLESSLGGLRSRGAALVRREALQIPHGPLFFCGMEQEALQAVRAKKEWSILQGQAMRRDEMHCKVMYCVQDMMKTTMPTSAI